MQQSYLIISNNYGILTHVFTICEIQNFLWTQNKIWSISRKICLQFYEKHSIKKILLHHPIFTSRCTKQLKKSTSPAINHLRTKVTRVKKTFKVHPNLIWYFFLSVRSDDVCLVVLWNVRRLITSRWPVWTAGG